jgi:hypothetical protein
LGERELLLVKPGFCRRAPLGSHIGEEVKAWTAENWARWKEEKPAWFKVEVVPDRFIPAAELAQLGYNRKRRGSAAGSVRESFREVSVRDDGG